MNKPIELFIKRRCIWYADDSNHYLNKRQHRLAYFVLKVLDTVKREQYYTLDEKKYGRYGSITIGELFFVVKQVFDDYTREIWDSSLIDGSRIPEIRRLGFSWIYTSKNTTKGKTFHRIQLYKPGFSGLLWKLYPRFIKIKGVASQGAAQKNVRPCISVKIAPLGEELWRLWNKDEVINNTIEDEDADMDEEIENEEGWNDEV